MSWRQNGPNVSKLAQKWGFCQFSQVLTIRFGWFCIFKLISIVLNYYCNKIGWKKFLGWKFDRLQIISMVFGYFLMFSSFEIVDFAHLSYFRLCLSIYLVFGLWKYSRPLNLAVSKLFFVSKLQFLPSKVTCVQLN